MCHVLEDENPCVGLASFIELNAMLFWHYVVLRSMQKKYRALNFPNHRIAIEFVFDKAMSEIPDHRKHELGHFRQ